MTQNTMTETPETETRADLSKTIRFLRKKSGLSMRNRRT